MKSQNAVEDLIDERCRLEIEFLKIISRQQGEWIQIDQIIGPLKISTRKGNKIIEALVQDISQYGRPGYVLEQSKNRGVKLKVVDGEDIHQLIGYILSCSPLILLVEALFAKTFKNVAQYAQAQFLSESTVRRYLAKISTYLERYHLSLGKNGVEIVGDEKQVRGLMSMFYWRVYGGIQWPFQTVDEYQMEEFTSKLLDELGVEIRQVPILYRRQLTFYFAESIQRTRKGSVIIYEENWRKEIEQLYKFKEFKAAIQLHGNSFYMKHSEIVFHYIFILSMSITAYVVTPDELNQFIKVSEKQGSEISISSNHFYQKLVSEFEIFPESLEIPLQGAIYSAHFFAKYFKGFNSDFNGNIYINIFQERYPNLIEKILCLITELHQETGLDIFFEEDFLLIPYTKIIGTLIPLCSFEREIYVVIESDTPFLITSYFTNQIRQAFQERYNLILLTPFMTYDPERIDVVITTMAVDEIKQTYQKSKVLSVARDLDTREIKKMNQVFKSIAHKN